MNLDKVASLKVSTWDSKFINNLVNGREPFAFYVEHANFEIINEKIIK